MLNATAAFSEYRSPDSLEQLEFECPSAEASGHLRSRSGHSFEVIDGIPNFVEDTILKPEDRASLEWYRHNAHTYDDFLPLTFQTLQVDEDAERMRIIDELDLKEGQRVLETGCGSGRDSVRIAERLKTGQLYLQDISPEILKLAVRKFRAFETDVSVHFALANGYSLPFPSNFFDRTFHFGGLNTFGEKKKALTEMIRVTKVGGRVVVGDESVAPWLRNTEFAKILMNSNPHFAHDVPLEAVPPEAKDLKLQWIMGDAFYLISFDKRDGEPAGDFDFEIPGWRGGTHRNRLYGQLEGVSPALKAQVIEAARQSGVSVADWLEHRLGEAFRDAV